MEFLLFSNFSLSLFLLLLHIFIFGSDVDIQRLVNASTKTKCVGSFLYSFSASLFPRQFLGCDENWILFRKAISTFANLRRFESYQLMQLANAMKITSIEWLKVAGHEGTVNPQDLNWRKVRYIDEVITTQSGSQ